MEGALIDPLAGSLSTLVGWTCCQTSSNEIKCSRSYMPRQSWSISYPEYINKTHKDRHNTGPCGCSTTSMVSSCKTSQTSILCLLLWGGGRQIFYVYTWDVKITNFLWEVDRGQTLRSNTPHAILHIVYVYF